VPGGKICPENLSLFTLDRRVPLSATKTPKLGAPGVFSINRLLLLFCGRERRGNRLLRRRFWVGINQTEYRN
jgi:hypothetical protein